MEPDAPLDIWLLRTMWTHATPHVHLKCRSTYLLTFRCALHGYNLEARRCRLCENSVMYLFADAM